LNIFYYPKKSKTGRKIYSKTYPTTQKYIILIINWEERDVFQAGETKFP